MALSRVVSEIFNVEKCRDLEICVIGQGHQKRHVSIRHLYAFLLTFHSNHGPISHRFRDRQQFQSKIAKFSHPPCILCPR